jgi:hypothetical protein
MCRPSLQLSRVPPFHIRFQSSSHSVHTNVSSDNHWTAFASYKRDGLVGIDHAGLEENITLCRNLEAFCTVVCTIQTEPQQHNNNTATGNCIYTHQIWISKFTHKQPESGTQNNEYSLHTIIGRSKTKTTQILWKDASTQLPHITTITTIVDQPNNIYTDM